MIKKEIKRRAKRSIIWKMEKEDLAKLTKQSSSLGEILKIFGLENKGGNSRTLKRRLDEENIDYSHIKLGLNSNKGRKFYVESLSFEELFRENSPHGRSTLKKYIIKNSLIPYKCSKCGLENLWNGKPLVLILDHINGIPNDDRLENLRFLCPNCNSQEDTFAGKNVKHIKKHTFCVDCGTEITNGCKRCVKCSPRVRKRNASKMPPKEQLYLEICNLTNVEIGKKYNVTETAVRKWLKKYNLSRKK